MRSHVAALALASVLLVSADPGGPTAPWGIHIAYGTDPTTSMSVMWSTRGAPAGAPVVVATSVTSGRVSRFNASVVEFTDSDNTQYIYKANLTDLDAGAQYSYTVGVVGGNCSAPYVFALHPVAGGTWGGGRDYPVLAIYGDMGVGENAHKVRLLVLLAAPPAPARASKPC